jgi:hypothetical protein
MFKASARGTLLKYASLNKNRDMNEMGRSARETVLAGRRTLDDPLLQ